MDTNASPFAYPHPNVQQQRGSAPTATGSASGGYGSESRRRGDGGSSSAADAASFFGGGGGGGHADAPPTMMASTGTGGTGTGGVMPPPAAEIFAGGGGGGGYAPPPPVGASTGPRPAASSSVMPPPVVEPWVVPGVSEPPQPRQVDFRSTTATVSRGTSTKIPSSAPSETVKKFPREIGTGTANAADFFSSADAMAPSSAAVDGGPEPGGTGTITEQHQHQHRQTVTSRPNGHSVRSDISSAVTPGVAAFTTGREGFGTGFSSATQSAGPATASDFFGAPPTAPSAPSVPPSSTPTPVVASDFFGAAAAASPPGTTHTGGVGSAPSVPSSTTPSAAVGGAGAGADAGGVHVAAFGKSMNDYRAKEAERAPRPSSEDVGMTVGNNSASVAGTGSSAPAQIGRREDEGGEGSAVSASPKEDLSAIADGATAVSDGRRAIPTPTADTAANKPLPGATIDGVSTPRGELQSEVEGGGSSFFGPARQRQPFRSRPTPPKPKLPLPPPTTTATRAVQPVQHHRRARSGSSSSASSVSKSVQRAAAPKFKVPPPLKLPKPPTSSGSRSISEEIKSLRLAAAAGVVSAAPTPPAAPTSSPPVLSPPAGPSPAGPIGSVDHPPTPSTRRDSSGVEVVPASEQFDTGVATMPGNGEAPVPTISSALTSGGVEGPAIAGTDAETSGGGLGVEEVMKSMVETVIDRTERASMPEEGGRYSQFDTDGGTGRQQSTGGSSYGSTSAGYQYVEAAATTDAEPSSATSQMGLGVVAPEDDVPETVTNVSSPSHPVTTRDGGEAGTEESIIREEGLPPQESGVDAGLSEGGSNVALEGPYGDDTMNEMAYGFEDLSSGGAVLSGGDEEGNSDTQIHALQEEGTPEEESMVPPSQNPADEAAPPPLLPGWAEYLDESSGMAYYFNEVTRETTWERPAENEESASSTVPGADTETTSTPHRHDEDVIAPEDDVPTTREGADAGRIDVTGEGGQVRGEGDVASVEGAAGGLRDGDAHRWETDLPGDTGAADARHVSPSLALVPDADFDVAPEVDIPTEHVDDDGIIPGGDDTEGDGTGRIGADVPAPAPVPLASQPMDASSAPVEQPTTSSEATRTVSSHAAASEGEGGGEDGDAKSTEEEDSSVVLSPLPPGWMEVFDPVSERVYYCHEGSGESTWQRPPCPESDSCQEGVPPSETQQGMDDSQGHDEADWCLVGKEDGVDTALLETRREVAEDEHPAPEDGDGVLPGAVPSPTVHGEGACSTTQQELGDDRTGMSRLEEEPGSGVEKEEGDSNSDEQWESKADIDATDSREDVAAETTNVATAASSSSPLPAGWVESVDPSSGRPYYWHEDGSTTWERPLGAKDAGVADEGNANGMGSATSVSAQKDSSSAVQGDALVPEHEADESQAKPKVESTEEKVVETSEVRYNGDAPAATISSPDGIATATTTAPRNFQRPHHALVSFGFGGRICVMRPVPRGGLSRSNQTGVATATKSANANQDDTCSGSYRNGPVHVFRLHHLVDPRIVALPSISQGSFVGPWIGASDESSVWGHLRQRCQEGQGERSCEGDEPSRILWKLIQVAALSKGRLRSDEGAKDPHGPEAAVVNLLLGEDGIRQGGEQEGVNSVVSAAPQKPHPKGNTSEAKGKSSAMDEVQLLLLRGRREEAVQRALAGHEYALALLVATMCDRRVYESAARRFVDEAVNPGSPLHTLAMLFSGQLNFSSVDRANDPGEESSGGRFGGGVTPKTFWGASGDKALLHNWRYHLASILSNRTRGWNKLVRALGDQLLDQGSVAASHFCYMVCGCPVSELTGNSRLVLVGCDCSTRMHAALMTRDGVESYERTEAFEWAKRRGNPTVAIPALQPFKLRYAMLLADFGYEERAKLYIESIRSCTGLQAGSGASKANASYSSTFLNEISVFEDRLCVSLGSGPTWDREGGVGNVVDDSVPNVVSSAFKGMSSLPVESRKEDTDVGDGGTASDNRRGVSASPDVHHDAKKQLLDASVVQRSEGARLDGARELLVSSSDTGGVESKGAVSLTSGTGVAPPIAVLDDSVNQLRVAAAYPAAPVHSSVESTKVTNGDKKQDSEPSTYDASNPFAVRQSCPDDSVKGTRAPASISRKEAVNEVPSDCAAVKNEDMQKFSSPFGHVPAMTSYPSATASNEKGSSSTFGGQSFAEEPHHQCRDDSNLMGPSAPKSQGKGIQSAPPSIGKPAKVAKCQVDTPPVAEKVRAPPKSEGSILSKTKKPPSSGNSNQAPSSESSSSWWRSKITKLLNPNATEADLGEENKAYYDEKLKRWIFPGDDPNEVAKPLAPPPTTPVNNPPAGPVLPCDNDDPLAALMAPPPRASATRSAARANYPVATMRPPSNSADTPSSDVAMKATPMFPSA